MVKLIADYTLDIVHVNEYVRIKNGKLESVCEHTRRWPNS